MKEKFYTIYKTTNLTNGKIYIGQHTTTNLNDKYMGSGIELNKAIKEEGVENFKKEILFIFDNKSDMIAKEIELVNDEFRKREDTYNITLGGCGFGMLGVKLRPRSPEYIEKQKNSQRGKKRGPHSEEHKRKLSDSHRGKKHSDETKKIIKEKRANQLIPRTTIEKMIEANTGSKRPRTPEHTKNQSQSHLGTKHGPHTQEHRDKIRESGRKTNVGKIVSRIVNSLIIHKSI